MLRVTLRLNINEMIKTVHVHYVLTSCERYRLIFSSSLELFNVMTFSVRKGITNFLGLRHWTRSYRKAESNALVCVSVCVPSFSNDDAAMNL